MSLPNRPVLLISLATAYGATAWSRRAGASTLNAGDAPGPSALTSAYFFAGTFVCAYLFQAIAFGIWSIFLYPFYFSPLRHLPQPKSGNVFLLGQFPRIQREATGKPALDWINSIPNDGLIRYLGLFNQERLIITKPKALAEVLVSKNYDFIKPTVVRHTLSRILGVGVLLAEGDEHRFQRKLLTPAFAFRHVKDLYPIFWSKGRESVVAMRRHINAQRNAAPANAPVEDSTRLEINSWASRVTLDIIGTAGLGRDFRALDDPNNKLTSTYRSMLNPTGAARYLAILGLIFPRWLVTALPFRRNTDIVDASRFLRQTCADLVQEKKAKMQASKGAEADSNAPRAIDVDILSVALESGGFSDEKLADQLMTFLAAGHETTSSAMTWAVYLLCAYPEVQDRLRAEIRANLPGLGDDLELDPSLNDVSSTAPRRDIASTDLDHLPYLNAVCSEVLRYFAPVPATIRETAVDTSIQGQFVPKGTRVMLVPWAVNRSEELWGPDALKFDPERWLRTDAGGQGSGAANGGASNYAFLTFLHGPRSCIGMQFARAEFACLLATWIGRFQFRLQDLADLDENSLEIQGNVSARPKKGMHVFATPVDGW
ncbi:cytochrome P450 monooxygenase [Sporothrix schenckii 1099-18]|uniref:Cytochrome P450 monooxygenase n=1 Tax=Sporothrix schenckii 1099-18 TaxID=1397361 RepID=A0A0F2M9L3_SPOSC|nr:cytochrome P450 monooxygenase [Sporothrix schenckii 1099-18]KJR84851.1 cytochrome P450 monooxygenase [Sporothrix schenckii 1099-18]